MPVAGLVRLRKHQFGRQSVFGTVVPATRAYPFKGVPDVNLNWTDPEIDAGSLDIVASPHREAPDLTAPLTDPSMRYNNLPLKLCGFFGGNVAGSAAGAVITWTHEAASTTLDPLDSFTYQFGDDVLTDWFELGSGILESWEITAPEGLGPLTDSQTWRFGSAASTGSTDSPASYEGVPTPGLDVAIDDAIIYLKDIAIYIASDPNDLESSQVTDALHSFVLRFSGDIDQKRWANGTQSFDVSAFVRSSRAIELECSWAKTPDTVGVGSEADAWFSDDAINRYVQIRATSTVIVDGSTPYSWNIIMPMRYYTRADAESNGNSIVVLTGHAFFDPENAVPVFSSEVVCSLSDAELGSIVS